MKANRTGFTIVELLITVVILGLFVIAIISLVITTTKTQNKSLSMESAARAGESEIESLRNSQYGNLEAGSDIDFSEKLPSNIPEPKSAIARISEDRPGLKRVDINITFGKGLYRGEVKQTSLIGIVGIGN